MKKPAAKTKMMKAADRQPAPNPKPEPLPKITIETGQQTYKHTKNCTVPMKKGK